MNPGDLANAASSASKASNLASTAKDAAGSSSALKDGVKTASDAMNNSTNPQAPVGAKPGDKVAPGKVVNENGEVEDSATKEGLKAAANVASALFTGGGSAAGTQAGKEVGKEATKEAGKAAAKEAGKEAGKTAAKSAAKGAGAGNKSLLKGGLNGFPSGKMKMGGNIPGGKNPLEDKRVKEILGKVGGEVDKAIGKAADKLDKVPGMKKFSEENKEGFKAVNEGFDAVGKALKGDVKGTKDALKNTKDNAKKWAKKRAKKMIIGMLPGIIFFLIIVIVIILPFEGGYLKITDFVDGITEGISDAWGAIWGADEGGDEVAKSIVGDVPDYDSLSQNRKNLLLAAALAIGKPYTGGGRPTSNTLDGLNNGVDAGGFAEWLIWNAEGADPGYLSGSAIRSSSKFTAISESDLKPGDFGVSGENVGIYMGNGEWIIVDPSEGVIRTKYSGFTSFYRYNNADKTGDVINPSPSTSSEKVNAVLAAANTAYNNKIPYEWGGKASNAGISGNGFGELLNRTNSQYYDYNIDHSHYYNGLDCSSFIGWIVWTGIGDKSVVGNDTKGIRDRQSTPISSSDLQPGDIGFYSDFSHVGIYAGNGMWYHQGSGGEYRTAVIDGQTKTSKGYTKYVKNPGFVNYYRLKALV